MSRPSSIEIYRPVILPIGSQFEEGVTSIARDLFDIEGKGIISIRPSNNTFRTVKSGMLIVAEQKLRFYHLLRTGDNVKHFGKKVMMVREKLEDGPQLKIESANGSCAEVMAGREPLNDTFTRVLEQEYTLRLDEFGTIPLKVQDVIPVKYPSKYPFETIFTLGVQADTSQTPEHMVQRMSEIAHLALKHVDDNGRVYNAECGGFVNRIPFARTRSTDYASLNSFERTVAELLPLNVQLGPIDFKAEY